MVKVFLELLMAKKSYIKARVYNGQAGYPSQLLIKHWLKARLYRSKNGDEKKPRSIMGLTINR